MVWPYDPIIAGGAVTSYLMTTTTLGIIQLPPGETTVIVDRFGMSVTTNRYTLLETTPTITPTLTATVAGLR